MDIFNANVILMLAYFLTIGTISVTAFLASFEPLRRDFLPLSCHLGERKSVIKKRSKVKNKNVFLSLVSHHLTFLSFLTLGLGTVSPPQSPL